jgi:hypothetical protein
MIHAFSRIHLRLLVSVSLAAITLPVLQAQPRCPGNIAGVAPRFVQRALVVIPVKINRAGPFDFMVDPGSQVTVIDPSLASLKAQGRVSCSSRGQRYQCATGFCRRADAEHSDRQPHPEPHLIRDPCVRCQEPPGAG